MKIKEIRSMDKKGLDDKLVELKKELIKLNAQVAVGASIKNPGQVKKVKKSIARVLSVAEEKKNAPKKEVKKEQPKPKEAKKKEVEKKQ